MLTEVILNTDNPMSIPLVATDPDQLVRIQSISGLAPTDFTLFTGTYATSGGYYQGRRAGFRNPVFTIELYPDYENEVSAADIRELLQGQFLTPYDDADGLQIIFVDPERPNRYLNCVTEKFESDLFAKTRVVSISTICVNPLFQAVNPTTLTNPSGWISTTIPYEATAPIGFKAHFNVVSATSQISIKVGPRLFTLSGSFSGGDMVELSSVEGDRYVRVNGLDALSKMTAASRWPVLSPGTNFFQIFGSTLADGRVNMTDITYRAAWLGV